MSYRAAHYIVPLVLCDKCGRGESECEESGHCIEISSMQRNGYFDPLIRQAVPFIADVEKLLSERSKDKVNAALFKFVTANPADTEYMFQTVVEKLERCQENDRISTFALAVWKAACVIRAPDTDMKLHDWMAWCHQGWKTHKTEVWNSREVNIIMQCVTDFLRDMAFVYDEDEKNSDDEELQMHDYDSDDYNLEEGDNEDEEEGDGEDEDEELESDEDEDD